MQATKGPWAINTAFVTKQDIVVPLVQSTTGAGNDEIVHICCPHDAYSAWKGPDAALRHGLIPQFQYEFVSKLLILFFYNSLIVLSVR